MGLRLVSKWVGLVIRNEWVFLFLMGSTMAALSFVIDYFIEILQGFKINLKLFQKLVNPVKTGSAHANFKSQLRNFTFPFRGPLRSLYKRGNVPDYSLFGLGWFHVTSCFSRRACYSLGCASRSWQWYTGNENYTQKSVSS